MTNTTMKPTMKANLWFDGGSRLVGTVGVILKSEHGVLIAKLGACLGKRFTCNMAEAKALLAGMKLAFHKKVTHLTARGDSALICNLVTGVWDVKNPVLAVYIREIQRLMKLFVEIDIQHIRREYNHEADRLANEAFDHDVFYGCGPVFDESEFIRGEADVWLALKPYAHYGIRWLEATIVRMEELKPRAVKKAVRVVNEFLQLTPFRHTKGSLAANLARMT